VEKLTSKKEPEEPPDEGDYSGEKPKKAVLSTHEGLNRVAWNLAYDGPLMIRGARTDTGYPYFGPMAIPGTYKLKLTVEGKSCPATLEIRPDPRVTASQNASPLAGAAQAGLEEQLTLALAMRDAITRLSGIVGRLRSIRTQLAARNELLKDDSKAAALVKTSKEIISRLDELEARLHNPKAEVSYDILAQKGGAKLYSQLGWLYELIRDSDGAPTQGIKEMFAEQDQELGKLAAEFEHLLADDLARLNEQAKKLDIPGIIVPKVPVKK
jgi:hypothetical protein